ncbi:hypothetical protein PoB_007334100 [Plakobranchus ocellatus]|uniref:Uncharacterized protein n=1 Tax=Plakobranchus ocellatus TaxID=259542 RepID=A0AAV4DRV2_9GAST|nr:hypothetical protein PoB_007334100 [Plakobranchus ocellatus]
MGNRRRNRAVTSPYHLEENQAASSRNTVMMGNHTTVSINGGSHPRQQRSHNHQQAGSGPQHQTCNNPRCRHGHEGPHCTLQMSTQNCQREFPLEEPIPVSSPPSAPMSQRAPSNPGQPSAQRQHQRRHHQTFQQLRHNRNQSRARRDQLREIRMEDENEPTVVQPDLRSHRRNRHRHHRRGHNLHQAAANHPRPVRTQTQPQNPQEPETQDALTESSGQREAMAQSQPLPSDRPTQTHFNSVSSQELSVQSTPSNSADERETMAPQQPLRLHQPCSIQTQSQPDNRQEHESSLHGNQSQQPNTNSQDHEDSVRVAQMAALKRVPVIPQEATNYRSNITTTRLVDEDFSDTFSEIWQIPDDHSSPDSGLSEDKIQEIPTQQFSRSADRSGSDQTSCVFCICDFEDKQLL